MSCEEKLRLNRINFAGTSLLIGQFLKKHNLSLKELLEPGIDGLVSSYQKQLNDDGPEKVIATMAFIVGESLLDIPFEISDDKKGYTVSFPKDNESESQKAHFQLLCKGVTILGEKLGANAVWDEKTNTHSLKFS
ncbi:MAG: hypothetical protein ACXAD7_17290 [Candidatus Kariarchaeaceae archaeon]